MFVNMSPTSYVQKYVRGFKISETEVHETRFQELIDEYKK